MRKSFFAPALVLCGILLFAACSPYGEKVEINKHSEVYIKDGANKDEANKLGQFLLRNNYFDDQTTKSVQLTHPKDTFVVKFVVNEEKLKSNQQAQVAFRYMQLLLKDSVFAGKPTSVILTDDEFKTIQEVQPFTEAELNPPAAAPAEQPSGTQQAAPDSTVQ